MDVTVTICIMTKSILGIRMRKGLAHKVWWYFHSTYSCAVLNGVSGVNHYLASTRRELSLLLYLAVSSALYVLPSV